jgi:hypothetical protein
MLPTPEIELRKPVLGLTTVVLMEIESRNFEKLTIL